MMDNPVIPTDLKDIITSTLNHCPRKNHSEDLSILQEEKKEEVQTKTKPTVNAQEALQSLNMSLDSFLAMYEDEDDSSEETAASVEKKEDEMQQQQQQQQQQQSDEFICCYCHGGITNDSKMVPCMICHYDSNSAYCKYSIYHMLLLDATRFHSLKEKEPTLSKNCIR